MTPNDEMGSRRAHPTSTHVSVNVRMCFNLASHLEKGGIDTSLWSFDNVLRFSLCVSRPACINYVMQPPKIRHGNCADNRHNRKSERENKLIYFLKRGFISGPLFRLLLPRRWEIENHGKINLGIKFNLQSFIVHVQRWMSGEFSILRCSSITLETWVVNIREICCTI